VVYFNKLFKGFLFPYTMGNTEYGIKKLLEVKKLGALMQFTGSIVDGAQFLKDTHTTPITARDYIFSLMTDKKYASNGLDSMLSESIICLPENDYQRLLVRSPIVFKDAAKAIDAHMNAKEYNIDASVADHYINLANVKDRDVFPIPDNMGTLTIPTTDFSTPITEWLFQDQTAQLGAYLNDIGVTIFKIDVYHSQNIKDQKNPFANQLWIGPLKKGLLSGTGLLYDNTHICTILKRTK
jgi:hypothetical protein